MGWSSESVFWNFNNFFNFKLILIFFSYGEVSFTLGNLVTSLLSGYNSESDLQKVIDFIQQNPEQGVASDAFKESIETIKTNIRWMKNNFEIISQFLEEQK